MGGCVPEWVCASLACGSGGWCALCWLMPGEGRPWAGLGVALSSPGLGGWRGRGSHGPTFAIPTYHLSPFPFPSSPDRLPFLSPSTLGMGWRTAGSPARKGGPNPWAREWPCGPAAVSRPLLQHRWGVEAGIHLFPPHPLRLTPPPSPPLFLFLISLRASPQSPAVPSGNRRPGGSLRVTVIIFIPTARPCAELSTHMISLTPLNRPSAQMRKLRSREHEGPAQVLP